MSFEKQLRPARQVLEAIDQYGYRDDAGELLDPYRKWAKQLRETIDKAEKYLDAVNQQRGGNHENGPDNRRGLPSSCRPEAGEHDV